MSYDGSPFALTPWVRRLLIATGAVYLLRLTVFTSPWLVETFGFAPSLAVRHPWGVLTYAFLHLLGNTIILFMFGPPVETLLGGRRFIRLWLVAALGGPALRLLLLPFAGDGLVIGASAAAFGVMLAFVMEWPDAPVLIFPLPVPVKAKWLVAFLVGVSLLFGLSRMQGTIDHFAHLGGFAAAFLYLRGGTLLRRARTASTVERAPAVLVRPLAGGGMARGESFDPPQRRSGPDAAVLEEVDRVLDKISAGGLSSLTPEERRFLDEMSKRFQKDH